MNTISTNAATRSLRRWLGEPLLQFLALGLLIFFVANWLENRRQTETSTIRVDTQVKNYLGSLYQAQFGYEPNADVLQQLIDGYIQDEVLFRDALQLGLAQQDEIIRRRLVQKMEYLILDSELQTQASDDVLNVWYQSHSEKYQIPAQVTFTHHYFEDNHSATLSAQQRAEGALATLRAQADPSAAITSDRFPLNNDYSQLSAAEVKQLFGHTPFSENLFNAEVGSWQGPWQSGYGWHIAFIQSRVNASLPALKDIRDQVFADWQHEDQQQRFQRAIDERKKSYSIVESHE
jgi:peptidyl-prolyl cis-trans isomerase C